MEIWQHAQPERVNAVLLIGRQWLPIDRGSWRVDEAEGLASFSTSEAILGIREDDPDEDCWMRVGNIRYQFTVEG